MTDEELEDWKKMLENPQKIYLSQKDFDTFVEMLELPSESTMESIKRLMNGKKPWSDEHDEIC